MIPLTRRHLFILLSVAVLSGALSFLPGCGYPKHIDPPLFTYPTAVLARLSAEAHAKDITSQGGRGLVLPIVGTTHSMGTVLGPGDYVVLDAAAPFDSRIEGEIIAYEASGADWVGVDLHGNWVVHRIVVKGADGLLLSGDGNPQSEARSRVTAATYRGLAVAIYRVKP